MILALQATGLIPKQGHKRYFATCISDAKSVNTEEPVVCIWRGTLEAPIEDLPTPTDQDFFRRDPVVSFAYIYRKAVLEKAAVIYPDMTVVDMTPYLKEPIGGSVRSEIEGNAVSHSLPIALHMLAVYGPKQFNDIMGDDRVVGGYATMLNTIFKNDDYALNFRHAFLDLLKIVKPPSQKLSELLDVMAHITDDIDFWGVEPHKAPFNIRAISEDRHAADEVFNFVLAHKRWPTSMDEVVRGEPMHITLQPLGIPLQVGRPHTSDGNVALTLTSCNVRDGYGFLKIDHPPGKTIEDGCRVDLRSLGAPGRTEGFVEGVPLCVKTACDLLAYIRRSEGWSATQSQIIVLLSKAVTDLKYSDLETIMTVVEKSPELQETANGRAVIKRRTVDTYRNRVCVDLTLPGAATKSISFPLGVPAKVMVSFLLTYGLLAQAKHVKNLMESTKPAPDSRPRHDGQRGGL